MQRFLLVLVVLGLALMIGLLAFRSNTSRSSVAKPEAAASPEAARVADGTEASADPDSTPGSKSAVADKLNADPQKSPVPLKRYRVHGTVRLKDSTVPLEKTRLALTCRRRLPGPSELGSPPRTTDHRFEATADDLGSYSFTVPANALLVSIEISPRDPVVGVDPMDAPDSFLPRTIDLGLEELLGDKLLDVLVLPPVTLRVRVLDDRTSEPLPGAHVEVRATNVNLRIARHKSGAFEVRLLGREAIFRDSTARVDAAAPGFSPATVAIPGMRSDGSLPDLIVRLVPGFSVSGTVFVGADDPAPGVHVLLLPCVDREDGETREFAGIFSRTSEMDGQFRFDELPRFERAWLVVRTQLRGRIVWYGEKRVLLETQGGSLEHVRVPLELECSVDVQATFPDGRKADRTELDLLRADADGKPWMPASSTYLPCPAGRPVRVIARGWQRHLGTRSPCWFGEATRTFSLDPDKPAVLAMGLVPDPGYTPPAETPDPMGQVTPAYWHGYQPLVVNVRDSSGGALDSAYVDCKEFGAGGGWPSIGGALNVNCVPGWRLIEVTANGHRSRFFELLVQDRKPRSFDLVLDSLH